ncbi:MAG: nuclear transport factor 2 family protein [Burkholderiales bacterium]|nr:nuclear transport factor 2 family protein [Burkholderiales bacterium]
MNDMAHGSRGAIQIERDVPYGEGTVGFGTGQPETRALRMDVFLPGGVAPPGGRPALVLSHGGAYHRGAKERDEFEQGGSRNTPVHEYCERFAARGYVCFSIGYRLTQELPAPQPAPIKRNRDTIERDRIDFVRGLLGLPPATHADLLNGSEAAWADVASAFAYVQANAGLWDIDPERMVIGGFSAGGFASAYAVYALGQRAAGVIGLSAGMDSEDAEYYVHGGRGLPPVLLFEGENDLPSIPPRVGALASSATRAGLGVRHYVVPGKPHFYDREAAVKLKACTLPGGEGSATVEDAILQFLDAVLAPPRVTVVDLDAFAQAWNRHDIDALMSFMTEDCLFHSSIGTEASGTRYVGRDAVRAGFVKAWTDFPDAQWTRARHFVAGRRGVSEWTFVGTRASDGKRVEVDGGDLFTFRGDKIRVKDSWRKQRS